MDSGNLIVELRSSKLNLLTGILENVCSSLNKLNDKQNVEQWDSNVWLGKKFAESLVADLQYRVVRAYTVCLIDGFTKHDF